MFNAQHYCVIMAGGIGSRFWPLSRKHRPKQFLDFFHTGRSLLQQTYDRFAQTFLPENILVATAADYVNLVREQLPQLPTTNILAEPTRRSTAPCLAWATYHIRARNPQAKVVIAPADHLILKESAFFTALARCLNWAERGDVLLTLGIKPHRPETGYGYIQVDEAVGPDTYRVKTFTEKPGPEMAQVFVDSGEFYWNSGLFIAHVDAFATALDKLLPDVSGKLKADATVYRTDKEHAFIEERFPSCPNVSIDYGIMEKADNAYVVLADLGWADVGSWSSAHELADKDEMDNACLNDSHALVYNGGDNSIALGHGRLAVIDGLTDYIVAESGNVLMICPRSKEKQIRNYVNDIRLQYGEDFV